MLERYVHIIKHVENLFTEADLLVHHILFDIDRTKAFFAGNTGDDLVTHKFSGFI